MRYFIGAMFEGIILARVREILVYMLLFNAMSTRLLEAARYSKPAVAGESFDDEAEWATDEYAGIEAEALSRRKNGDHFERNRSIPALGSGYQNSVSDPSGRRQLSSGWRVSPSSQNQSRMLRRPGGVRVSQCVMWSALKLRRSSHSAY